MDLSILPMTEENPYAHGDGTVTPDYFAMRTEHGPPRPHEGIVRCSVERLPDGNNY